MVTPFSLLSNLEAPINSWIANQNAMPFSTSKWNVQVIMHELMPADIRMQPKLITLLSMSLSDE